MQANVGRTDAGVRWGLAIVFLVLAAVLRDFTLPSLVALLLALLCGGTAMTRNCPLYALLHHTTVVDTSHPQHS